MDRPKTPEMRAAEFYTTVSSLETYLLLKMAEVSAKFSRGAEDDVAEEKKLIAAGELIGEINNAIKRANQRDLAPLNTVIDKIATFVQDGKSPEEGTTPEQRFEGYCILGAFKEADCQKFEKQYETLEALNQEQWS